MLPVADPSSASIGGNDGAEDQIPLNDELNSKALISTSYKTCCGKINFDLNARIRILEDSYVSSGSNALSSQLNHIREEINATSILQARVDTIEDDMSSIKSSQHESTNNCSSELPLYDTTGSQDTTQQQKGTETEDKTENMDSKTCRLKTVSDSKNCNEIPSDMILDLLDDLEKNYLFGDNMIKCNFKRSSSKQMYGKKDVKNEDDEPQSKVEPNDNSFSSVNETSKDDTVKGLKIKVEEGVSSSYI
jgi:hypothetical protein